MTALLNYETTEVDASIETEATADLPPMIDVGDVLAPQAPSELGKTGVDASLLADLALKFANTVPNFETVLAAQKMCLPMQLVEEIFWQLKTDQLVEILGQTGPFGYRYSITQRGREHAHRLLDISGYVGPAPVSLETYTALLDWQIAHRPELSSESARAAISDLVLPEEAVQVAELAASSGRSLFLFGPPGNGKTSLGRLLHNAVKGDLWIPYCISIGSSIIRIFDPQSHQLADASVDEPGKIDQRWVRIRRPFVVVGGEMPIEALDLAYSPSLRFYEAPMHVKANGGTFLVDDFGRQRVDPHELLNRWIIPLEHQIDHLTLHTGQKVQMPFRLLLIVATNLSVSDVADPAFLRRMGYRLHLDKPTVKGYTRIFERYASQCGTTVAPELISRLVDRYKAEGRELRSCEPRDLIERARDICRLHKKPLELNQEVLDIAWIGYFGNEAIVST